MALLLEVGIHSERETEEVLQDNHYEGLLDIPRMEGQGIAAEHILQTLAEEGRTIVEWAELQKWEELAVADPGIRQSSTDEAGCTVAVYWVEEGN